MWWYVLFGLGLLAGFGLAFRGWRGRRFDDHPLCRTCRYDLSGTPALPERCPECGRALGGKKPIRIGNRRRSSTLVVLGVASVVGSGAVIGLRAERDLRNVDWMAIKPVWWLRLEARHGDLLTADDALKQLWKRWNGGILTESQMASLVELASAMQRAITIGPLTRGLQARRPSLRGTLDVTDAPTNFAFRAWLRAGDREWPMSTIIIHQGKSEPLNLAAFNLDDLPGDVRSVDIVLKPDLYTADASFEPGSPMLDVEILIPGVPVKSGEATTGFVPTGGR